MSTKAQKNAVFIAKLKTLQFVTPKTTKPANCAQCGEPMTKHVKGVLVHIRIPGKRQAPAQESFAA